jgi:putative solute:sodium symporter small subunit
MPASQEKSSAYWRANIRVIGILLSIWAVSGLLLSIVFVEQLNRFKLGGYPLGFWMAQQGTIYIFIVLIYIYARWMEKIDDAFGRDDEGAAQ